MLDEGLWRAYDTRKQIVMWELRVSERKMPVVVTGIDQSESVINIPRPVNQIIFDRRPCYCASRSMQLHP